MMRLGIILLCCLATSPAIARDVFKWISDDGVVIYSDTYRPGAERITVDDNKARARYADREEAVTDSSEAEADTEASAEAGYKEFTIAQPANDETIRSNEGVVSVGLSISPSLMEGHGIQIFVDGGRIEGQLLTSTQFTLTELNRGTHSLQAKVVDETGATLIATETINFHLRKASIIKP